MKRTKVGTGYYQSGYGRGLKKRPIIYLINGKLYAKDKEGAETSFMRLTGELEGYVPVNKYNNEFFQLQVEDHDFYRNI